MKSNSQNYSVILNEKESIRFWNKVDKTDSCWVWTAAKNKKDYGIFHLRRRTILAHRLSYVISKGDVDEYLKIDHLCRKHYCVNPDHLEPVTQKENVDRGDLSNIAGAHQTAKTKCPRSHYLEYPNLVKSQLVIGKRQCLACDRARSKYSNAKAKGIILDKNLLQDVSDEYYREIVKHV